MSQGLWPLPGMVVYDENGDVIPSNGITVPVVTGYYDELLRREYLFKYDPLAAGGTPSPVYNLGYEILLDLSTTDAAANDARLAAAYASAPTNGATLRIGPGSFPITVPVVPRSNTTLVGAGRSATRLVQTSLDQDGIRNTNTGLTRIAIRDLSVHGPMDENGRGTGTGTGINLGANTAASTYLEITSVDVETFGVHGLCLGRWIVSELNLVLSRRCGGNGFYFDRGTSITVKDCYALSARQAGFYLFRTVYTSLVSCACDSSRAGYILDLARACSLVACGAEALEYADATYDGKGWKLINGCRAITITSCFAYGMEYTAMHIGGAARQIVVQAFREEDPGASTISILVDDDSQAMIIEPAVTRPTSYGSAVVTEILTAGTSRLRGPSASNGPTLELFNVHAANNQPVHRVIVQADDNRSYGVRQPADSDHRFVVRGSGRLEWGTGAIDRDVNLYRSAANILATDDDFALLAVGAKIRIAEGSNAAMGVATLVAGTAVVATTAVTATSRVFAFCQSPGGSPGWLRALGITPGVGFTITSSSGTDTSVVAWVILRGA